MFIDIPGPNGGDSAFTIRNDFVLSNSAPGYDIVGLGGTFSKNKYIFNLSRYVQSIVTKGYPNPTLRIYAPFSTQPYYVFPDNSVNTKKSFFVVNDPVAFGRIVLYGGAEQDTTKRMRLRIIYSKI
jgi:hypothetical protein